MTAAEHIAKARLELEAAARAHPGTERLDEATRLLMAAHRLLVSIERMLTNAEGERRAAA